MLRALFIAVCLAASVFMQQAASFADEDLDNPNLRVSEGHVAAVDLSGSTVTVGDSMPITFPVSPDTRLVSDVSTSPSDIKLSDIDVGDYVTVGYVRNGQDSRIPEKVLKITVEYKAGDN